MKTKTDGELQHDVMAELEWDPSVDHAEIGVSVHGGVVTLSGCVKTYPAKIAAEKAARRVAGVRAIAEEIQVRFAVGSKPVDHEIARRIVDLFSWNASVPNEGITVTVDHGWVTLGGATDWFYQADAARAAATHIDGVRGVTSEIGVRCRLPVAANVKERIVAALQRQAELDGADVTVVTDGNKVRLGGRVRAWRGRGIAERAAWAAPGVAEVEDNIVVGM